MNSSNSSSPVASSALEALTRVPDPQPSDALWLRIDASVDAGVRPIADPFASPDSPLVDERDDDAVSRTNTPARWWARVTAVAACATIGWIVLRPSHAIEAGMISGTMALTPAMPTAGQRVQVRYTAGALLGRPAALRLRARVRTVNGLSYVTNEPVITVGVLKHVDGTEYRGEFTLPDSIVYAALAVEDSSAREVDDFGGRTWEVLRAGTNGEPLLAALEQRTNDLMGRSWEQGLAGVRRMVALYPDSLAAWRWLRSYESWMVIETDSSRAVHRRQLARLSAKASSKASLSADEISDLVWYARALDSTIAKAWLDRLLRDTPTHSTAVYMRGLASLQQLDDKRADTASTLRALEALWSETPADRREWLAGTGADLAVGDSAHAAVWAERLLTSSRGLAAQRAAAQRLLTLSSQHRRGEDALRALLRETTVTTTPRLLNESAAEHRARVDRSQRATLAVLGRALAKDGALAAARDTLLLATQSGWEVEAFGALGDVQLALGDTSAAIRAWSHVAVDPRISMARRTALDTAVGRLKRLDLWNAAQREARGVMAARVLERAAYRRVDDVPVAGLDGASHLLSALRGTRATVVLFWSHECGYAVEAVPELQALSARLAQRDIPLVFIADSPVRTPALDSTLKAKRVTIPVYLDATSRATATFNNWGTPMMYVLDAKGRVVFAGTSDESQILLYAEALLSGS